jgi:hypothetical protein
LQTFPVDQAHSPFGETKRHQWADSLAVPHCRVKTPCAVPKARTHFQTVTDYWTATTIRYGTATIMATMIVNERVKPLNISFLPLILAI